MGAYVTHRLIFMVHFGRSPTLSILTTSVFSFLLPAINFKRNLDSFVGAILTISASMIQHIEVGPDIRMPMKRTMNEKDPTTVRTYEHRSEGLNNESDADLASLAVVLTTADMVVRGKAALTRAWKSRRTGSLQIIIQQVP